MAKRHERTRARRQALEVLYAAELRAVSPTQVAAEQPEGTLSGYAKRLISGTENHFAETDAQLQNVSENWSLDRMPVIDRAILRMAVFEMRYVDEVPVSVAINEAVELAKDFGGKDDSSRFVNGLLGCVAREMQVSQEESAAPQGGRANEALQEKGQSAAPQEKGVASQEESAAPQEEKPSEAVQEGESEI